MLHWEILDAKRRQLLKKLERSTSLAPFYLAEGTGLSLQAGYRESVDFDFFTEKQFNAEMQLARIREISAAVKVLNLTDGTCDLLIDGVPVSFFYYPYPLLAPLVKEEGIVLSSARDIAAMKMIAIGSRGAKKDFYDLYQIIQEEKITPAQMSELLKGKFGDSKNFFYIGMALSYFDDAESDILPRVFKPVDWNTIKKFFISYAKRFLRAYRV